VTGAKRATAHKRERPRVWDAAQVIVWFVHRTWEAVVATKGVLDAIDADRTVLDAREEKRRTRSLGYALGILFKHDNPYFANGAPTAGRLLGITRAPKENLGMR
jgi:hypothetical protein